MKAMFFPTGVGNGEVVVSDGQLLTISMVPGPLGSWARIGRGKSIWVPPNAALSLEAADLGLCCGANRCDQYPGEGQIRILFGTEAFEDAEGGGLEIDPVDGGGDDAGSEPLTWLVVWTGCQ